jgi:hypothetical protein
LKSGRETTPPAARNEIAVRRLRRCAWTGVAGLLAALPVVYAMGSDDPFTAGGLLAAAGWLIVAALTWTCFRMAAARQAGERGPLTQLFVLPLVALLLPGTPILMLAPWALVVGAARFAKAWDPRELVFVLWGLFGVAFFVVIVVILLTARRLRRLDRQG